MHTITRWLGTALLALGLLGQGVAAEDRKPIHFGELT